MIEYQQLYELIVVHLVIIIITKLLWILNSCSEEKQDHFVYIDCNEGRSSINLKEKFYFQDIMKEVVQNNNLQLKIVVMMEDLHMNMNNKNIIDNIKDWTVLKLWSLNCIVDKEGNSIINLLE